MPVPKPDAGESRDHFIGRCVSFLADEDPSMPNDQRVAICFSQWGKKDEGESLVNRVSSAIKGMHADFIRIFADFANLFGGDGERRFNEWVTAIGMDPSKPYTNQAQLYECLGGVCESYDWAKPLIRFLRQDTEHKYYKVRALTASISMNKNDYTNLEDLERSARTLTGVPLNLNHDPNLQLPYPASRVEWAEYEDKSVEAIIRIHNAQEHIQRAIENGDIVNPSIEGDPRGGGVTEDGRKVPKWYHFTALALLEKDVTLPGVPATYGFEPLFLNESLGRSLVESLSVESNTEKENKMTDQETADLGESESTAKTETLEEGQGIQGLELCGQCKYFTLKQNTTETSPASTGDPGSDNSVTITGGALGKGIGVCSIDGELKKRDDPLCTDGRPLEDAIDLDRSRESVEELVLKDQINELEEKNLKAEQARTREIQDHVKTKQDLTEAADKVERTTRELAVEQNKNVRLKEELRNATDKLDTSIDRIAELEVRADKADSDVTFYKDENKRIEEKAAVLRKQLAASKVESTQNLTKANEESTKRATAIQEAINAEQEKARLSREVAELTERISTLTREISDSTQKRADQARRNLKDQTLITELREKVKELTDAIRELKRRLSKVPREIIIEA